jgi:fructosamine-3-kinase
MNFLPSAIHDQIIYFLQSRSNVPATIISTGQLSGGSINNALRLETNQGIFFLKYNKASRFPQMFEKEAKGLDLLRTAGEMDVPEVLMTGEAGEDSFLLLSYVSSSGMRGNFWEIFGERLAALHKHKSEKFGLDHDNYMGSLQQSNQFHDRWAEFFIHQRLEPQVRLARETGEIGKNTVSAFERLYTRLDEIFPPIKPSLIHGDLWSGNFMVNHLGEPCLIDPAVYFGHPEVDIAMSTLFGGFHQAFYDSYNYHHPLEKGWRNRLDIYNLYPLLIHVNLFGGSYAHQVERIVGRF